MDISSFKGLLRNGKPTPADLTRLLHSVMTGISRYTVEGGEEELAHFRESMLAVAGRVHEQASNMEVETAMTQALNLFRDYSSRNHKFNQAHTGELRAVMRTMTETITYLSESRTRSVHHLQFVERELEQASQIDDIRLLRARVVNCLDVVREETVRMQNEEAVRSDEVRQTIGKVDAVTKSPSRFGVMDSVTGLPSRRAAERTIGEALQAGNNSAVAVFLVSRLSAINSKYGRAVGDEVMLRVANHFAQHLSSDTHLFRWSGPALVAVINTQDKTEEIKRAWSKAAGVRQEISLDTKERTVFVVVETSLLFQVVTKTHSPQTLFHTLDQYVAAHGDYVGEDPIV